MNRKIEEAIEMVIEGYDPDDVLDEVIGYGELEPGVMSRAAKSAGLGLAAGGLVGYSGYPMLPASLGDTRGRAAAFSAAVGAAAGAVISLVKTGLFVVMKKIFGPNLTKDSLILAQKKVKEQMMKSGIAIRDPKSVVVLINTITKKPEFQSDMIKHSLAVKGVKMDKASRWEYCNRIADTVAEYAMQALKVAGESQKAAMLDAPKGQ